MAVANSNLSARFMRCHTVTAKWEGGWSNHPADPGGKTMYGVTQATYDRWMKKHGRALQPVRDIPRPLAEQIYFEEFWLAAGCEKLDPGVDLAVYDPAVNSGPGRARKWLLASVGGPAHVTVQRICAKRLSFVQALKNYRTFGKGWSRRIADIEATGVAWALAAVNDNRKVAETLKAEASKAQKKAGAQAQGGAAIGAADAGTGATSTVRPEVAEQIGGYILGGLLAAGALIAAYFIIRAIINSHRARAYALQAGVSA